MFYYILWVLNTGFPQNSKAELQNQANQYITTFGALIATENCKYELNSWIPFFIHQIVLQVSSNYLQINDQIMAVNGFLEHQRQWPKQVLSKSFRAIFKIKGISFYHLKILNRMFQETLKPKWPSSNIH